MRYFIILFVLFNIQENFIYKEKLIGDKKKYNLEVTIKIDERKRKEEINFDHIVNQKLCFRFENKILTTKTFNVNDLKGYAVSEINIQEYKSQKFYNLELFKSNGSPEIFMIFDLKGFLIAKMKTSKMKTEYKFFKKSINSVYFEKAKTLESYDLTDLLL